MEKFGQILALPKNLLIAVRRLSGDELALSVSLRSPALPWGEPLAGRATSYWTPEPRYGAKGRASLQRAGSSLYNLSVTPAACHLSL